MKLSEENLIQAKAAFDHGIKSLNEKITSLTEQNDSLAKKVADLTQLVMNRYLAKP